MMVNIKKDISKKYTHYFPKNKIYSSIHIITWMKNAFQTSYFVF